MPKPRPSKTPEELRNKGESLREEKKFHKALYSLDEAIILSQEQNDPENLIVSLKDRSLTWLHLYNYTDDLLYATLAKKDAESMVEISIQKNLGSTLAISYFTLGKCNVLFEDFEEASKNYSLALENYKGPLAEKGDYRYHLGEALYQAGDKKKGKELLLKGLSEIREGRDEIDEFLANVWESRCLMILGKLLSGDSPKEAEKYALESKKIVDKDERLLIIKDQLVKVQKEIEKSKKISQSKT